LNFEVPADKDRVILTFGRGMALNDISFKNKKAENLGIIKLNGTRKTFALSSIGAFYKPQRGAISYESKDIIKLPQKFIAGVADSRPPGSLKLIYRGVLSNRQTWGSRSFLFI
jgi:ABC-type branched-subunit amino acid transport system ATPase component